MKFSLVHYCLCRFTHKYLHIHLYLRYTGEITEPVPFLSQHGTQIVGLFPVIKITLVCQAHMSPASHRLSVQINRGRIMWCQCVYDAQKFILVHTKYKPANFVRQK